MANRGIVEACLGVLLLAGLTAPRAATAADDGTMVTGGLTSQPIGHYEFCRSNPQECSIRSRNRTPQHITSDVWRLVVGVNLAVNKSVKPLSDYDVYGREEVWAYPDRGAGDCEDYVLEKRRRLSGHGVPLSDLLITVVRKPDGEGHAVLTMRTDRGDFILDNLTDQVKLWTDTDYRYLKRQATFDTGRWVSLREDKNLLVGAVRP